MKRNPQYPNTFTIDKAGKASNVQKPSLTYKMDYEFVDFKTAVASARKIIRESGKLMENKNMQRFFLKHEDKHRMNHINAMLNVVRLYTPDADRRR